jgi:hypothetical protein
MRLPDLTLAVRNLMRRPAFALTAVLLLALGAAWKIPKGAAHR